MPKIIIYGSAAAIILWGFSLPLEAHDLTGKAGATVHMTQERYEPKDLTIAAGETVVFENISATDLWPASNIHPTHEIYPEFDPTKPVSSGKTWSFTFEKAGIFPYHDHLYPRIVGTITVVENTTSSREDATLISRITAYFTSLFHRFFPRTADSARQSNEPSPHHYDASISAGDEEVFHNYEKLYSYVKKFGPERSMQHLHTLSTRLGSCHDAAHRAGRFIYELQGNEAFQKCSAECHSGCYHGATEQFFKINGTATLAQDLDTICSFSTNPFFSHQCLHGIGHGLMAWANYELPKALTSCELLQAPSARESCYTGVFMENIVGTLGTGETEGHYTQYLNDDPHYPCSIVDDAYKASCYFLQTSRMMHLFSSNFEKIAVACSEAPERFQGHCFGSMGRDVGGTHRGNPKGAIAACAEAPEGKNRRDCLTGAAQDTFWDPSGQDEALQFCQTLMQREEKEACYRTIFERAPQILTSTADLQKFCKKAETAYQDLCLRSLPQQ